MLILMFPALLPLHTGWVMGLVVLLSRLVVIWPTSTDVNVSENTSAYPREQEGQFELKLLLSVFFSISPGWNQSGC